VQHRFAVKRREIHRRQCGKRVPRCEEPSERGCGGAKNFVASGVAVLVVNFLETVKIKNDDAQWKAIAASAVQFLFEGFREERRLYKPVSGSVTRSIEFFSVHHIRE